jgi:predicted transcriptional regulator of viral defense system
MANIDKNILAFFEEHPVFTIQEVREFLELPDESTKASKIISQHKMNGRIGVVKEGVYYTVRPGQTPSSTLADPFLLAAKLAPDSVLAFHSALELLGFSHSLFNSYYFFSQRPRPAFKHRDSHFRCVLTPEKLQKKSAHEFGTEKVERIGVKVLVTGKERTLVEVLERPQYCGGLEEVYRCLEKMPYIQPSTIFGYLDLREEKNLYARVGFFLEQHRDQFHIEEAVLQALERNIPAKAVYWIRQEKGGVLQDRWNLIVPQAALNRTWEEL